MIFEVGGWRLSFLCAAEWRGRRVHMIQTEASLRGLRWSALAKQWSYWSRGKWEREQWAPEQITLLWYRGGETKGWEMSPTQEGHGEKPKRHKDRLFVPAIRGRKICRQFCRRNGNRRRGSQLIWVIRSCVTFAFWCVRAVWLCRQARPAPTKKTERGRGDLYFVCTSHIFAVA